MKNTTNNINNQKSRFFFLKSMFRQAPLSRCDFLELIGLAKKFDKKMHSYLEAHRECCCFN